MSENHLPKNWRWHTVDELKARTGTAIAIGPFGSRMKSECYVTSGIPVIRGNNLSDTRTFRDEFVYVSGEMADSLRSSNVFADDLVFPHRGAIGEVGIVPHDGKRYMLSTSLMKMTCNRDLVNPLFLFYFFRSTVGRYELLKNASTVGTPGIGQPLTSLRSIRIPLPPLEEQKRIVDILGSLDDKISLNRRMNKTLEATVQTIFQSWFIDFTPVRAKEEGRQPFGMDSETAALFPDGFVESVIGEVPKGWRVTTLPEAIDVNPKRTLKKGAEAPYLDMANMPTQNARALEAWHRSYGSGSKFINGDTLVARITPCLENGKTAFVDFLENGEVGWGSTEYIVLRPKAPLPPEFAYFLARTDKFRTFAIGNMTGSSGRQRVPPDCFNKFMVVVPPADIAHHFGVFAQSVLRTMKATDEQSKTLERIRDALLPKLMSGTLSLTTIV